ncbi:IS982 family transposase [Prevotella sp. TCVGH]|nr:IS982 family transposase [Prevotella sp. TCVGH]
MISEIYCNFIVLIYKELQTKIAIITEDKVTEIFCMADDFCNFFDAMMAKYMVKPANKRKYHRDCTMSKAEIMLIMILFYDSGYRCLKHFYLEKVCKHLHHLFPKVVSYNRFVELEREAAIPLALSIKKVLLGKCTGISFVDSTPLCVYRNQRIHIHKVFKGIAQRGKCSMGWFFGFKLHLICNEKGELLNFMITPGDIDDRKPLEYKAFLEFIYGELVGDKGFLGKNLFQKLFGDGIQLITKLKSNMKGALMSVSDKLLIRKRAIIETVNDELKNIAQVEHSRRRCFDNFIVNILGTVAAYCLFLKKPCIYVQRTFDTKLTFF